MSVRPTQAIVLLLFPLVSFAAYEGVLSLRSARTERAIARVAAQPTAVAGAMGTMIAAPDRSVAERDLIKLLGDRASAAGVRLATGVSAPGGERRFVASDIVATGSEAQVLRFANALESGRPTARFARWTLLPGGNGLRLEGRLVAGWQVPGAKQPGGATIEIPAPKAASPIPPAPVFAAVAEPGIHGGFPAELIGIVGRLAVDPQAMLRLADGNTRTIALGETVEGWTLSSISTDRVRFRRGGTEKMLVLPTAADQ